MAYRDLVLYVGCKEIGNSLKSNPTRVKEYIDFSCTQIITKHLEISWCTHFVHWVVENAGMVAKIEKAPLGDMSTAQITKAFSVTSSLRPGDIYKRSAARQPTTLASLVTCLLTRSRASTAIPATGATLGPIGRLRMVGVSAAEWSA